MEIVTSEYMKRYNVVDRTARRDLVEFVEKGLLHREGEGKANLREGKANLELWQTPLGLWQTLLVLWQTPLILWQTSLGLWQTPLIL